MALPDIIVVGAQKCGTTTVHKWLTGQADISPPIDPKTRRPVKEVHFFTNNWDRGLAWYEAHFEGNRSVDTSPNYLSDTRAHGRLESVHANPRIVVCLRDPVDHAYSQYNHYKQELPQSASYDWPTPDGDFHTNVLAELAEIDEHAEIFRGFIARGLYLPQIQSLMTHLAADQIHVTIMERWNTHPAVVAQLADFLQVGTPINKLPVEHQRAYTVEAIEQRTIDTLCEVFRPCNDRLFEFLGFDVPEWR